MVTVTLHVGGIKAYVKTRSYKVKRHSISNNRAITSQAKAFSRIPQDHSSLFYLV